MNIKLTLAALLLAPLALTACAKKEEAPKTETTTEAPADVQISAEQQAAIDSVDQPIPEAIAIDESVVEAANAENAALEAEKNGTAPTEAAVEAEPAVVQTEQPADQAAQ